MKNNVNSDNTGKLSTFFSVVIGILLTIALFLAIALFSKLSKGYNYRIFITEKDLNRYAVTEKYTDINMYMHQYIPRMKVVSDGFKKYNALSSYMDDEILYIALKDNNSLENIQYVADRIDKEKEDMKDLISDADKIDDRISYFLDGK